MKKTYLQSIVENMHRIDKVKEHIKNFTSSDGFNYTPENIIDIQAAIHLLLEIEQDIIEQLSDRD